MRGMLRKCYAEVKKLKKSTRESLRGTCLNHRLRDKFAVDMLKKSVPIEEVSKLLSHESIKTTELRQVGEGAARPAGQPSDGYYFGRNGLAKVHCHHTDAAIKSRLVIRAAMRWTSLRCTPKHDDAFDRIADERAHRIAYLPPIPAPRQPWSESRQYNFTELFF